MRTSTNRLRLVLGGGATALTLMTATGCPPTTNPPSPTTTTTTTTSTTTTTVAAWIPANTCFDGSANQDILYAGPENVASNATGYSSTDGTCSGTPVGTATLVRAADQAAADALCAALTPSQPVGINVASSGFVFTPPFPADAWQCFFAPA